MTTKKQNNVIYKREKGKVEISGDSNDVKAAIWFDLITNRLLWFALFIVSLFTVPKISWIPFLVEWIKEQVLLLIFLPVAVDYFLRFSSG